VHQNFFAKDGRVACGASSFDSGEESDEDEEWEQEQQGLITSGTKKRQSTEWKQELVKRTRRSRD
jgi:hypothetical protein